MNDVKSTKQPLYPSQINTKTISCRISAQDYVTFLNEAVTNGITLNDWLLMKIYNQGISAVPEYPFANKDISKIDHSGIFRYIAEDEEIDDYRWIIEDRIEALNKQQIKIDSPEGLYIIIKRLASNIHTLLEMNSNRNRKRHQHRIEELSVNNIKAQILTLAQNKFDNQNDLKSYMSDVSDMLSEIS